MLESVHELQLVSEIISKQFQPKLLSTKAEIILKEFYFARNHGIRHNVSVSRSVVFDNYRVEYLQSKQTDRSSTSADNLQLANSTTVKRSLCQLRLSIIQYTRSSGPVTTESAGKSEYVVHCT